MTLFSFMGPRSGRTAARSAVMVSALVLSLFVQAALAQTAAPPLNFFNNFFVTGDYVVGGVGLRGAGDATGFATGTITIPDANTVPNQVVPAGADIVAAYLYWETVEGSQTTFSGQQGFFNGYAIAGAVLGNPNAPVSWSSGGCSGASNGSKTMRSYRADVRPYLKLDSSGRIIGVVRLADSGTNGAGVPFTLGASLVVIYRVLSPTAPLNSVVIYDGAFAPSNTAQGMSQQFRGFYEAAAGPVAKITHIVGNGQTNKFEQVSFVNDKSGIASNLPSLYSLNGAALPPFPGYYNSTPGQIFNGSWDNPTWPVSQYVNPEDASETTSVVPSASNSGCVSWGVVILSSTVQDTDNDGLLDAWEINQGYSDAKDGSFVALPGANPTKKDIFIQVDSMCSVVKADGTCDTVNGHSHAPDPLAVTMMTNAFSARGVNLHLDMKNVIPETACSDDNTTSPPKLCPYPGQAGVVGWKGGFEFLKNQPLNYPDEATCEANTDCIRRFPHGRKDSYHYVLSGHSLGLANWTLQDGTLASLAVANNIATLTSLDPHGLTAGTDRVTVSDAISSPNLSGTYFVQSVVSPNSFTIQTANVPSGNYTKTTDPSLSVSKGKAGTTSGYSDIGGADSSITLGGWGADGQTVPVQAGTFMHELGHTLALTHGGLYFDNPNNFVATVEANCKPNFQSVMNYLFQVDLLGPNGVLDYSSQALTSDDESSASPPNVMANALFSTTSWYAPNQLVGSPATHHCDGSPLLPTDPPSFRLSGASTSIQWFGGQDINFDGTPNATTASSPLRGFNDWAHVDLRQIGATGSNIPGGGIFGVGGGIFGVGGGIFGVGGGIFGVGGGIFGVGGGIFGVGGGIFGVGGGIFGVGGGIFGVGGGVGNGEITVEVANSVVRPPRNLVASLTSTSPRFVQLNWTAPSFGQIAAYNVYKSVNGGTAAIVVPGPGAATSFLDKNVTCGPTYTYFVTALLSDGRESVPSNSVSLKACAPPYTFTGFFSPLSPVGDSSYSGAFNIGKSVTAKWTLQDSSGNFVGNLNANTLYAVGPVPLTNGACLPTNAPVFFNFTTLNQIPYPYPTAILYSPTTGAKGNSTFRIATSNNQFIFNWDTTPFKAGCYILEVDLDSGQVERTGLKLQ
jgi:hypothetical protein